jgi:mannose-1-phosphate guanylyltransferase/mannose-6-phosphate isomerase
MPLKPIILCGGSGTRLWPESRKSLPKQFMPILENKSLFELCIERVISFKGMLKPIIVCNKKHAFFVKEVLDKLNLKADLILEPEGRNTTAAIYLAAKTCSKKDNLIIMPSDHLIKDNKRFNDDLQKIEDQSDFTSWITLGINPTYASAAYGYIKTKYSSSNELLEVLRFVEKPTEDKASQFLHEGNYFWNSGIFLGKASMIMESIQTNAKNIADSCEIVFNKKIISDKFNEINFSLDLFSKIPSLSLDFAVMEFEKNIKLYPLTCDWNDIGSWDAISKIDDDSKFQKNVIQINSINNYIRSNKKIIATIDVKDLIIIESDNATLITKKNSSEKVKLVVDQLIRNKISEGTEHSFEKRPWGKYEIILDSSECKVKKIYVSPKKRLSLQYHKFRSEHWLVVDGEARVYLNGNFYTLSKGESIDIPLGHHHYLENITNQPLIIIETQLGTYFGEDDIIRLDDPYGR